MTAAEAAAGAFLSILAVRLLEQREPESENATLPSSLLPSLLRTIPLLLFYFLHAACVTCPRTGRKPAQPVSPASDDFSLDCMIADLSASYNTLHGGICVAYV